MMQTWELRQRQVAPAGHIPTEQVDSTLQHRLLVSSTTCDWCKAADAQPVTALCESLLILYWVHPSGVPAEYHQTMM